MSPTGRLANASMLKHCQQLKNMGLEQPGVVFHSPRLRVVTVETVALYGTNTLILQNYPTGQLWRCS